jgi:hypothetical protein
MSLNPVEPGLRSIHHDANSVSKVQIVVQADDVLLVGDAVADQLLRHSPQFKEVTDEQVEFIQQRKQPRGAPVEDAPKKVARAKKETASTDDA